MLKNIRIGVVVKEYQNWCRIGKKIKNWKIEIDGLWM